MKKFKYISYFLLYILVKLRTAEDKQPKYTYRNAFPKKMPIRAEILFRAKTNVTSLSLDTYSDTPQKWYHDIFSSMCIVLKWFYNKDQFVLVLEIKKWKVYLIQVFHASVSDLTSFYRKIHYLTREFHVKLHKNQKKKKRKQQ